MGTIGAWQQKPPSRGTRKGGSAFTDRSGGCGSCDGSPAAEWARCTSRRRPASKAPSAPAWSRSSGATTPTIDPSWRASSTKRVCRPNSSTTVSRKSLEASTDASGEPYVVVEHVEGRSLGEVRTRAVNANLRIDWCDVVAIGTSVAEALGHIHERTDAAGKALGIVHRDLSPQNVMVGYGGDVKLIDFGTARGENRRCHTISGVVFAKPGYVAPEVAGGVSGDFRVDLYALGIMLWELLAGRRFLQGDPSEHLALVAKDEK